MVASASPATRVAALVAIRGCTSTRTPRSVFVPFTASISWRVFTASESASPLATFWIRVPCLLLPCSSAITGAPASTLPGA
ncbi:hypothetical protein D3C81_2066350 [compost metagenome]